MHPAMALPALGNNKVPIASVETVRTPIVSRLIKGSTIQSRRERLPSFTLFWASALECIIEETPRVPIWANKLACLFPYTSEFKWLQFNCVERINVARVALVVLKLCKTAARPLIRRASTTRQCDRIWNSWRLPMKVSGPSCPGGVRDRRKMVVCQTWRKVSSPDLEAGLHGNPPDFSYSQDSEKLRMGHCHQILCL